jgi:hypothetical protein
MQLTADRRHQAAVRRMVTASEELQEIMARDPQYKTSAEYRAAFQRYKAAREIAYPQGR